MSGSTMGLNRGSARDSDELQASRGARDDGNRGLGAAKVLCDQANELGIGLAFDRRGTKAGDPGARGLGFERADRRARFRTHGDDERAVARWLRGTPARHCQCSLTLELTGGPHLIKPSGMLSTTRDRRERGSVSIEHVLPEAVDITRQDEPGHRAGGEDVRAWNEACGIVKGSTVENLHRREPLQRETDAVAAGPAKAEMQHAPMII